MSCVEPLYLVVFFNVLRQVPANFSSFGEQHYFAVKLQKCFVQNVIRLSSGMRVSRYCLIFHFIVILSLKSSLVLMFVFHFSLLTGSVIQGSNERGRYHPQ